MRIILSALSIIALSVSALPAIADDAPGGAPPQSGTYVPQASADSTEVICKDIKKLGSRLESKRVCMTRQDWEIQQKAAKDTTEEWQRYGAPQQGH
jgi:hypothetical protein